MDLDDNVFDLSAADFGNDKNIQEKRKQEAEYNKMMHESVGFINTAFNAKSSSHKNLKEFFLHKALSYYPFIKDSYEGRWKGREFYFCVFEYVAGNTGRLYYSGLEYYLVGLIELKKNYPHTIGQPETIALKLEDLFTRVDVDFDHAGKFSRRFHVITKDERALQANLFNKDLDRIAAYPSAEFELNEKQCYFRLSRRSVSMKEATDFVELAKIFMEVL
jgi:hypothetical protein